MHEVIIEKQEGKLEMLFKLILVGDKSLSWRAPCLDFLCYMHKEVLQLLT